MENKVIVYKNRLETRLLLIVYCVIFLPLTLFVLISDIIRQNEHLLKNLLSLLLVMAVASIPLLIIVRYKIIFNYQNRTITYVHYFKPKKIFSFDEIKVQHVELQMAFPAYDFVFYAGDKKVFKISDIDFVGQTKQSDDCLKELFTGTEKAMFDWEMKYREQGVIAHVSYTTEKSNRILLMLDQNITFHIIYLEQEDLFAIQVCKPVSQEGSSPSLGIKEEDFLPKKVLEEHLVSAPNLDATCDKLIARFRSQS